MNIHNYFLTIIILMSFLEWPETTSTTLAIPGSVLSIINTALLLKLVHVVVKRIIKPAKEKERLAEEEKMMMMYNNEYDEQMHHGYNRKKRSLNDLPNLANPNQKKIEEMFNKFYQKDSTKCLEKLMCELALKSTVDLLPEDTLLLSLTESDSLGEGFVFKKMKAAMRAGVGGSDCGILFDRCPSSGQDLIKEFDAPLDIKPRKVHFDSL